MVGTYDLGTVLLSYAIASLSGFAAFEFIRHARESSRKLLWTLLSGLVLGLGIWSMHFVGMLAWVPPFPLFYSVDRTIISVVAAIAASVVAMRLGAAPGLASGFRLALGSISVAAGICTMHYIGMSAMRFNVPEMWNVGWVLISCFIAIIASLAALLLLNFSSDERFNIGHQVLGALVIGLAICGMHYSGMRAMMLTAGTISIWHPGDATGASLAKIGVGNTLVFTFCLLVVSYQDRIGFLRTAHEAEMRAQEAGRLAEQLGAAGRIAASIAHEVNNPLEAVTNLLYLAEHCEINPEALSYLHLAQSELRRVSEITTHTLKFYRQQDSASLASISELVDSVMILFKNKLERSQITVERDSDENVEHLYCRAGEIRQVIANLVGNAIDAMAASGGTLSVSVCMVGNAVVVRVTDTGAGISKESQEKLFEPFFTTKGAGGTGLGLSISAEIVSRHRGTLQFESRTECPNQGTTFELSLPLSGLRVTSAKVCDT